MTKQNHRNEYQATVTSRTLKLRRSGCALLLTALASVSLAVSADTTMKASGMMQDDSTMMSKGMMKSEEKMMDKGMMKSEEKMMDKGMKKMAQ
jgi:hypothetical protein